MTDPSSRIRDYLANERTYLAWMRTAIALMGFGVVIARLRYFLTPELPETGRSWRLGILFILVGLLIVPLATQNYFTIRDNIGRETYSPSGRWIFVFSLVLILLGGGVSFILLKAPPHLAAAIQLS
jgi:putative membrane protein